MSPIRRPRALLLLSSIVWLACLQLHSGTAQEGATPMHLAAMQDDAREAAQLIREHPEIVHVLDIKDGSWVSPLYTAAEHGSIDVLKLLLANGADVDSETEDRSTPLLAACNFEDQAVALEMANVLVKAGADPKKRNRMRYNARKVAAERGHTKLYKYLRSLDAPRTTSDDAATESRQDL